MAAKRVIARKTIKKRAPVKKAAKRAPARKAARRTVRMTVKRAPARKVAKRTTKKRAPTTKRAPARKVAKRRPSKKATALTKKAAARRRTTPTGYSKLTPTEQRQIRLDLKVPVGRISDAAVAEWRKR